MHPWRGMTPVVRLTGSLVGLVWFKLLVNLLQAVKRTNTPTNTLTNGVVGRTMVFLGSQVRIPPSTTTNFFRIFPHVELEKNTLLPGLSHPQEMKPLAYIDRSARISISGRPGIPPFQGGEGVVIRLSLGKQVANLFASGQTDY